MRRLRYEYIEFVFTQHGIPWRSESAQRKFEALERERWRVYLTFETLLVLRRLRTR